MRKRNCRVQVRLDNKEYQGFMKAVRKSGLSQEVYLGLTRASRQKEQER